MSTITYRCLQGFHDKFIKSDIKPKLSGVKPFLNLMQGDFSGENLVAKILDSDDYWEEMINTRGFGRGVKYEKANNYRDKLRAAWVIIKNTVESENETEISKLMGFYIWDLQEDEFTHSYLGLIYELIKQNKLWKSPIISDIFCSFFGFTNDSYKSLEEIAIQHGLTKERPRQLKDESLEDFENDFWFLKEKLILEKLEKLFDISSFEIGSMSMQVDKVNRSEKVNFSIDFYTKILSIAFDMVLVGNINDITIRNKRSSKGNVFSKLYLQTQLEHERCDLEAMINAIALVVHKNQYYFKEDTIFDLSPYTTTGLYDKEIINYTSILEFEFENEIKLYPKKAIIKRNSQITQPEMAEAALGELGGFAYADDVLEKVSELYPEKEWTMPALRSSFKGDKFYSVGKSGLFGLYEKKDLREQIGNGTLNDTMRIFMSKKETPVHIYELLIYLNNLFPRPKTLRTIHSILEQDSRSLFVKYDGGFYGLQNKKYKNTEFPKIFGGHANYIRQTIDDSKGLTFDYLLKTFNSKYGLREIQVKYLLDQMLETKRISLIEGLYYSNVNPLIHDIIDVSPVDNEVELEEIDFNDLNQSEVPSEILHDATAQIKIRRGQPKFRKKLLNFYQKTCIVTGCQIPELLEAAHILPYSEKKDYSLSNGLLLRADIHTLFDLSMIAICPESLQLKLNKLLMDSPDYTQLNNIDIGARLLKLNQAYNICEVGLNWRWNVFVELE